MKHGGHFWSLQILHWQWIHLYYDDDKEDEVEEKERERERRGGKCYVINSPTTTTISIAFHWLLIKSFPHPLHIKSAINLYETTTTIHSVVEISLSLSLSVILIVFIWTDPVYIEWRKNIIGGVSKTCQ